LKAKLERLVSRWS